MWEKNPAKKIYFSHETKKKWKNFITPKWVRQKERIGIFMKQELEKNINNKSSHVTFQTRLWCQVRLLINLEGLRKILNTRDSVPFNAVTELSMGNIKKACECYYNARTFLWCFNIWSWTFLFPDRTAQKIKFYLVRFLKDFKLHHEEE